MRRDSGAGKAGGLLGVLTRLAFAAALISGCDRPDAPGSLYRETVDLWATAHAVERRFILRIAGRQAYAPCSRALAAESPATILCGGDRRPAAPRAWVRLDRRVERSLAAAPSVQALHARALIRLVGPLSRRAVRAAEADLEQALALGGAGAALHNDLAVVLRLRATLEKRPGLMLRALDAVLHAGSLAPLAAARFNAVLLLAELGLARPAAEARDAIGEAGQGWAHEACEAVDVLATPHPCAVLESTLGRCLEEGCQLPEIDSACREVAVVFVDDLLLPRWAAAELAGDADRAGSFRELAGALGERLGSENGSGAAGRLLAELRDVSGGAAARLAASVGKLGDARAALGRGAIEAAEARLRALRTHAPEGSVLTLLADFELARAAYLRTDDYRRAGELFAELERRLPPEFHRLGGLVARFRGLCDAALGFEDAARGHFARAIERLRTSHHELSAGFGYSSITQSDFFTGRAEAAWSHWFQGISGVGAALRPRVAYNLLDVAFLGLQDQGLHRAGLAFAEELVALGADVGSANHRYQAHLRHGIALEALDRHGAALEAFERARAEARRIPSPRLGERARSDVELFAVESRARAEPLAAVEELSRSLAVHRRSGLRFFEPRMLAARSQAHRLLGDPASARRDLRAAVESLERTLGGLTPRDLRTGFLDARRQVFDRLLELELEAGAPELETLRIAEQARLGAATRDSAVDAGIRAGSCLLYYRVLPDRLLVWAGAGERLERLAVPVTAPRLRLLAAAALEGLVLGDDEVLDAAAAELYELLLRPAAACVKPAGDLLLVPDDVLFTVPFAALRNPRSGRLLIEEKPYRLLPGLAWTGVRARRGTPARVVTLASPVAPERLYPSLEDLRHAAAEASRVAAIYPGGRLLGTQGSGTRRTVAELEDAAVFHFAGHAVSDFTFPLRSALVLGEGESDRLSSAALAELDLEGLDLVFLSSCQALNGPASRSAGALSLARAFLDAGAGAAVASVTDVDDALTAALSAGFHRRLAAGVPASRALRLAQLDLARRTGGPHPAWAGYSLLGQEVVFREISDRVRLIP